MDGLPKLTALQACQPDQNLAYAAFAGFPRGVLHGVTAFERIQRVEIERRVDYSASPETFTYSHGLKEGRVEPGGPFTGSATYADGRLTGDLTVSLPGRTRPFALAPARAAISRKGPLTNECERVFEAMDG
jgi:hypothetical protein